jgi:hypothetical protein
MYRKPVATLQSEILETHPKLKSVAETLRLAALAIMELMCTYAGIMNIILAKSGIYLAIFCT